MKFKRDARQASVEGVGRRLDVHGTDSRYLGSDFVKMPSLCHGAPTIYGGEEEPRKGNIRSMLTVSETPHVDDDYAFEGSPKYSHLFSRVARRPFYS